MDNELETVLLHSLPTKVDVGPVDITIPSVAV